MKFLLLNLSHIFVEEALDILYILLIGILLASIRIL